PDLLSKILLALHSVFPPTSRSGRRKPTTKDETEFASDYAGRGDLLPQFLPRAGPALFCKRKVMNAENTPGLVTIETEVDESTRDRLSAYADSIGKPLDVVVAAILAEVGAERAAAYLHGLSGDIEDAGKAVRA